MSKFSIADLMARSGVKFGTSGARGLVRDLTDRIAFAYTAGFLNHLAQSGQLGGAHAVVVGGDLRPSTERIMSAVARAVHTRGLEVVHAGRVPSPAVMLHGLAHRLPSIMVTGSHIPDDRNGIKFNTGLGEISKADEIGIRSQTVELPDLFDEEGQLRAGSSSLPTADPEPARAYVQRWLRAFPRSLAGLRVGVYGHSAVGRELLVEILEQLGAEVTRLGWSERFIPVDTEAIRAEDVKLAAEWAREHRLDALVSTDGDSDRPLIADESGTFLRGDVACVLAARYLGATFVAAPVSCNSVLEKSSWFSARRTRIGSPFVIEAMLEAKAGGESCVVGYEANGGFLHVSELSVTGGGKLSPLPTRDPVVVQLALLTEAKRRGVPLSRLALDLPQRFTASDRIENFAPELGQKLCAELASGGAAAAEKAFPALGRFKEKNELDGVRITFENDEVVHVRPSGNAPELRCYVEASSVARGDELLRYAMARLAEVARR
ncbi:MAG TPA: phosphomannomutase [Polyangiaceae bacterium]|nr:phosphomannomutase [Polyangiaceae bacterium]